MEETKQRSVGVLVDHPPVQADVFGTVLAVIGRPATQAVAECFQVPQQRRQLGHQEDQSYDPFANRRLLPRLLAVHVVVIDDVPKEKSIRLQIKINIQYPY